jgi:uncharacterized protein (DUF362 family)/Pyruvate/2-oxoacid:ferredoxin oxidoreductase delta subunit
VSERVSIEHGNTYDYPRLKELVVSLLKPLGGIESFVARGDRVLLKPNMLAAKPPEAAVTTHPALVRAVAELVREAGCEVMIGDSPGLGEFRHVAERSDIQRAATESSAKLVPFDDTIEVQGAGTFRRITIARAYWDADKVINLPKLKTHEMMTMTCAVKNLFGAVVGAEKAGWHLKAGTSREMFARLLLEIYLLKKPALSIVDGIVAMEGNGPGSGDPVNLGVLLAGVNPVAVDVVAARLAGIPADLLHVEREARRQGQAGSCWEDVELIGAQPADFTGRPFKLPAGLDVQFGLPRFIREGLRNHLTARPYALKDRCTLCGVCRDACPPGIITIKNSAPSIDYGRCIRCWCCRELCPSDAMEVKRGIILKAVSAIRRSRRRR